ncbi:MAG TPA: aldo/keto reductase [Steroidobacteraceae bacterium]|nr:aldo/keto reductase [Steroidobacteraceae bacterium]
MNHRKLGPFMVSSLGLGCMNLSHAYGVPPAPDAAARILLRAVDLGVTHFDTAALYGFGANEELLGRTLAPLRSRFTLASKCGVQGVKSESGMRRVIDGRPATLKQTCEDSLRRLRTEVIDLYYLHRWDKSVPIEDSVGALGELVREGKIRAVGLSEVSAATLERAHAVHPIAAVQSEYSLCTRNPEIAVIEACRSVGATFVAFSPLARGFLTGALRDIATLEAKDLRRSMPRFEAQAYAANLGLLEEYARLARAAHASMAQLALAWVLTRGEHVVAIPGTTCETHLEENLGAATVELPADMIARLDALINQRSVVGERYSAATQAEVDTENF